VVRVLNREMIAKVKIGGLISRVIPEAFLGLIGRLQLRKRLQMEYLLVSRVVENLPRCWEEKENMLLERVAKDVGEGWW